MEIYYRMVYKRSLSSILFIKEKQEDNHLYYYDTAYGYYKTDMDEVHDYIKCTPLNIPISLLSNINGAVNNLKVLKHYLESI